MKRIYFNPNWNPEYFYPLIKPLCLIYDQLVIWSPVSQRLEKAEFLLDDFIRACKPDRNQPPVIIPASRDNWFDRSKRKNHPDNECRIFDASFEKKILKAAQDAPNSLGVTSILSTDDLNIGYRILDNRWADPDGRKLIDETANTVKTYLPDSVLVRIDEVSDKLNRQPSWAIANAFAQDILAIQRLNTVAPLVHFEHAQGYLCLAPSNFETLQIKRRVATKQELPGLPVDISAEDVKDFIDLAFHASELSWTEIAKLRRSTSGKIRIWLNEALEPNRKPLAESVKEIAALRAQALNRSARVQVRGLEILAPALLFASLGITSSAAGPGAAFGAGALAGSLIRPLSFFKLQTPLTRVFARYLGKKVDRFLVDTPFFVDAQLKETDK